MEEKLTESDQIDFRLDWCSIDMLLRLLGLLKVESCRKVEVDEKSRVESRSPSTFTARVFPVPPSFLGSDGKW